MNQLPKRIHFVSIQTQPRGGGDGGVIIIILLITAIITFIIYKSQNMTTTKETTITTTKEVEPIRQVVIQEQMPIQPEEIKKITVTNPEDLPHS